MAKKISFMCTAFRDGFQSVFGARVFTKDFLPALEATRDAGITWYEAGGGARFQSLYFYCNEDAFAMMDTFRETVGPDANLQTLARGINVVGLESQSRDIIKLHAEMFKKHGMTTIRNFDALNDVNNLIYSGQCIVDAGLKHQVVVTLMALPPGCEGAHTPEFYDQRLEAILEAGIPFDAVCFKDASGTASPATVHDTIKRARKRLPAGTFIHYHTHETAGISVACNLAALQAGADAIDLSLAPVSGGTAQPDLLLMWQALRGSEFELDVDIDKVRDAEDVFKDCMKDYFIPPEATAVEPMIPWSPMPGGALTANTQMLRDNGIMDRYPEMIKAMPEVVKRGGFGTSVTPVSQFYFQQSFNNVMFGPWKKIADSYGKMVLGYFGKTPVAPDPEIVELARKQLKLEPTTRSPLEINDEDPKKGREAAIAVLKKESLPETEENIFIVATCKDKGVKFLQGKAEIGVRKIDKSQPKAVSSKVSSSSGQYALQVGDQSFDVAVQGSKVTVNGRVYDVSMLESGAVESLEKQAVIEGTKVKAQMPGKVLKVLSRVGDRVAEGQSLLILEAMKMEMEINSPAAGTVRAMNVKEGQQVSQGEVLAEVG